MGFGLDRTILPIIIGPLVSYWVLSGQINQACQSDVSSALEIVFGSLILLVSMAISIFHPKAIKDMGNPEEVTTISQKLRIAAFLEALKKFALKQTPPKEDI